MKFAAKVLLTMMIVHKLFAETDIRFQSFISSQASTLGELVEIHPENEKWNKIPLDSHPIAGEFLEKNSLMDWISKKIGEQKFRWLGKHNARIYGDIRSTNYELASLAKNKLLTELSKEEINDVEIQIINSVPDSEKKIGDFKAEIFLRRPLAKRICVWLKAKDEKHPVWFKVKTWTKVWVAKHRIRANQLLKPNDFLQASRDIAGLKSMPVKKFPDNYLLKNNIKKNEILMNKNIESQPPIQKGQSVRVTIKEQGLTIHIQALAENNGYTGQMVKLKNLNSNKSFYARVVANNQAEVKS